MSTVANRPTVALPTVAPYRSTAWIAFGALMLRDLTVLRNGSTVGSPIGGALVCVLIPSGPSR